MQGCCFLTQAYGSSIVDPIMTVILFAFAVAIWLGYSMTVTVFFSSAFLMINLLFPYILVNSQKFKSEIRGPWDEAIISSSV